MCGRIGRRSTTGRGDDSVAMLVIDAAGDKAFCAGGDIAEMLCPRARRGISTTAAASGPDEYRMNAKLFNFPKPVATFLQGFTMGGGVGVGCHASHRIVCDTSKIAMPECGIGLVPDVGGSLILARAPGRLGEYLGVTALAQMGPGDAIHAGLRRLPRCRWTKWDALKAELGETADWEAVDRAAAPAPDAPLAARRAEIDRPVCRRRPARHSQRAAPCGYGFRGLRRWRRWAATVRFRWPAPST